MFNLLESAEERLLSPAALPGDPDSQSSQGLRDGSSGEQSTVTVIEGLI